jgi:DMSO reductase anchor subunit
VHPAYSVIFFTTFSGLGYGLLVLLGLMGGAGLIPADRGFGLAALGLALVTVTAGLFASTLHLGHPERAWRAFSQWRTSWLSREGVAAIATYLPTGIFALGWVVWGKTGGPWALAGITSAAGALITIACTGMIYASLPTIAAWSNRWTVPAYLTLGLATGSLWLAALSRLFAVDRPAITHLPVALILAAWIVKTLYWARMDHAPAAATPETATGLGGPQQKVRLLAAPNTQENFVMREMGFRIARKHAVRLRRTAVALAFLLPLVLTELMMFMHGISPLFATATAVAAALLGTAGVAVERWLFFAEARHVVTLYYDTGAN